MHPDLSPHLHCSECNRLIAELQKCHEVNKFGKFVGICNDLDRQVNRCLKQERANNQRANREKALARNRNNLNSNGTNQQ